MSVDLNHTIVHARDKHTSAEFLARMLGLNVGEEAGPFVPVELGNGVTLDYANSSAESISAQHYAFLVSEEEFSATFKRIQDAGVPYYADPQAKKRGEINRNDGGRGLYFPDPDGHWMEILTIPYGGWPSAK